MSIKVDDEANILKYGTVRKISVNKLKHSDIYSIYKDEILESDNIYAYADYSYIEVPSTLISMNMMKNTEVIVVENEDDYKVYFYITGIGYEEVLSSIDALNQ